MNSIQMGGTALALVLASSFGNDVLAADASASFSPGPFKMLDLGQGSVPVQGPIIHLTYDKDRRRYTQVDRDALEFPANVQTDCNGHNYAGTTLKVNGTIVPFSNAGLEKTGSGFSGRKTISTQDILTLDLPTPGVSDPVALCNDDLDVLVANKKQGVAQKGWARKIDLAFPVEFSVACSEPDKSKKIFKDPPKFYNATDKEKLPVWIHCGPAAVFATSTPPPKHPGKKAGVQSARVWVNPSSQADYHGECPATLNFGGEIAFVGSKDAKPSNIRYRYRTKEGDQSPVFSTEFLGSASKNIHYWKKTFGASDPGKTLAAPGAGAAQKVINSWVRLEVLDKNDAVVSTDQASIKITCEPKRIGDPGKIKAQD